MATRKLHLTMFDQLQPKAYIRGVLFFPFPDPSKRELAIKVLTDSIQATLDHFPHFAGTLGPVDHSNGRISVTYTDDIPDIAASGMLDIRSWDDCPFSYEEFKTAGGPPSWITGQDMCPNILRNNPGIVSAIAEGVHSLETHAVPVFAFRAIFFTGGLALAAYGHHSVMDGNGYASFLERFAENCRLRRASDPPTTDNLSKPRIDLDSRLVPFEVIAGLVPFDSDTVSPSFCHKDLWKAPSPLPEPLPKMSARLFVFRNDVLQNLRNSFTHIMGTPFTINNVLSALVWTHVTRARGPHLDKAVNTNIWTAADHRGRIQPPLPSSYEGNVAFHAHASMRISHFFAEDVVTHRTIAPAATVINKSVTSMEMNWALKYMSWMTSLEDIRDIRMNMNFFLGTDIFFTTFVQFAGSMECDIPGTTSSEHEIFRKPYSTDDGGVLLMPRRRKPNPDGTMPPLEVLVQLAAEDMERLLMEEGGLTKWAERIVE